MRSFYKNAHFLGTAATIGIALSHAIPTVAISDSSLSLRGADPPSKSLASRYTTTTENPDHGEEPDLGIIDLALYTTNIQVVGAFGTAVCAAAVVVPNPAGVSICVASAVFGLGYIIASHWLVARAPTTRRSLDDDPRYGKNMVLTFPQVNGKTATYAMASQYNATNTSEPLLVGYHNCTFESCYNYFYENYQHPTIGLVHKVSQKPRGGWKLTDGDSASKRSPQTYTDETASNDSVEDTAGTAVYGTYIYWDTDYTVENTLGEDYTGEDVADALYTQAYNNTLFENQGYFCVDIIDEGDSGAVVSTGFLDVTLGENEDDPDDEASYLSECYDDEFSRRRK